MKTKLFFLAVLSSITIYAQTQIGDDIDGEAQYDLTGQSVSLSSDGNIVAIGNASYYGYVRIFQNLSGVWTQIGADIYGEGTNDAFGGSVSLSSDGSVVAIGAVYAQNNVGESGHVRVYENLSGVWTQIGADIDGEGVGDESGSSVSISSDGNVVAIGAPRNDGNGNSSGHVRLYQNLSGVWTQIGADINGETAQDNSGRSVGLSSDGSVIAIGAANNDGNGDRSGHVRVYQNISDVWTQVGADIDGEAAEDYSGASVSISSNGSVVAIGAYSNGWYAGHVRVYQNLSGVWTQIGADIDSEASNDYSGESVSLSSDGSVVAIGAPRNDGINGSTSGHVRIYKNMSGIWTQVGIDIDGEAYNDRSGTGVSLSSDGNTVAIGATGNDENGSGSGHVRVYDLSAILSLENNEIAKNFTLYPNPVTNQLQLQIATSLDYNKATIYNYFGQLVLQSETTTIDVSNLAAGIYFLEVETNKGKGVKRFIKQ